MVIDLHRRLDEAVVDVGGRDVLHVTQPRRQRQAGRIALGLRRDVEIDGTLQPFARAGHLGEARRRDEQRAGEHNPDENNAFHRTPPPAGEQWQRNDASRPIMSITKDSRHIDDELKRWLKNAYELTRDARVRRGIPV